MNGLASARCTSHPIRVYRHRRRVDLVQAYGGAVFDLIEQHPERLREVTGIGARRAARIVAGWAEQKVVREKEYQEFCVEGHTVTLMAGGLYGGPERTDRRAVGEQEP
jgi:hypothetical protein